jgi:hypothetical protein
MFASSHDEASKMNQQAYESARVAGLNEFEPRREFRDLEALMTAMRPFVRRYRKLRGEQLAAIPDRSEF